MKKHSLVEKLDQTLYLSYARNWMTICFASASTCG